MSIPKMSRERRIVVTGGPGGGKTTAADMFRRELGPRIVVVPEAATLLFAGGFPRATAPDIVADTQIAIYHVQRRLEDVQAALYPNRILLCDRGTLDGSAYWPRALPDFFAAVGSNIQAELARYDAVLFFETAAAGGLTIEGNAIRTETGAEAVALDARLRAIWSGHPRFVFLPHSPSFFTKIANGLAALERLAEELAS
jgi:predicted ATPase